MKADFFERVEEGTWMGHVIEHIALEIQTLAGMDVGFGRTRETSTSGIYNVVFTYMEAKVGRYAAEASVEIAQALIDNTPIDLPAIIQKLREMREEERLGPFHWFYCRRSGETKNSVHSIESPFVSSVGLWN
jgi:cyanophycin synthetase